MIEPTTEAVWSHLADDLRAFIRRRVKDEDVADDLLQETFLRIHRSIGKVNHHERLTAWVYRIARNVIVDRYRVRREESLGDIDPTRETSDEVDGACRDTGHWLQDLIRQLPPDYQEAVRLAEVEGLPQRIVAERLGLSLAGAKSRVQRGRAMLQEALHRCCEFEVDRRGNVLDFARKPTYRGCQDCEEG